MAPAAGAAPTPTVRRPPARGRPPRPTPSGTTVLLPDSVVLLLFQTICPGPSAETPGRGRARPCRPEASPSRDGRLGPPCPPSLPAAIGEAGRARPGRRSASATGPTAPDGPGGPSSLGAQPLSGNPPVRRGGHRGGRRPPPSPPVRGDRRPGTPAHPAHRGVRLSKGGSPGSDITPRFSSLEGVQQRTPERGAPHYAYADASEHQCAPASILRA